MPENQFTPMAEAVREFQKQFDNQSENDFFTSGFSSQDRALGRLRRGTLINVGARPSMRRSAIRNFRKSGISEIEGMKFSGHKTNSVYKRYDIVDEEDLRHSMEKVQNHLKREAQERKVVPLKRAG